MTETTMATTMATTLARTMATRMTTTKRAASLVAVFLGLILMAGSAGAEGSKQPAFSGTVNLNTASVDELMELPGVGPSKAEAILAFRKARGGFKKVEDLMKVKGIGRKTFQKLRPFLALNGPGLTKRGPEAALEAPRSQGKKGREASQASQD